MRDEEDEMSRSEGRSAGQLRALPSADEARTLRIGRRIEHPGRQHIDEIDPQIAPVNAPQIGDLRLDLTAENIVGQAVADADPEPARRLLADRGDRRALIILCPPTAIDDFGARRFGPGEGKPDVATARARCREIRVRW